MPNYPTRDGFRIPMPKPGDGTKIVCHSDGTMTCSWDRPRMALDAALGSKPMGYGSADNDPDDVDNNPGGDDTENKVRQLLEGKLEPADLDALCDLIFGDDAPAPAAQDRRRRQARDAMPSRATMERLVAQGAANRAQRAMDEIANLSKRFPALKGARVV